MTHINHVKMFCLICLIISACGNTKNKDTHSISENTNMEQKISCSDNCKATNQSGEMACKLTSPELQKRKETVLLSLKNQMLEKKELQNGYAFKFPGTDKTLNELTEFIQTERECCDFFIFGLSISGDKSQTWLELTGPEGSKEFIDTELGL